LLHNRDCKTSSIISETCCLNKNLGDVVAHYAKLLTGGNDDFLRVYQICQMCRPDPCDSPLKRPNLVQRYGNQ